MVGTASFASVPVNRLVGGAPWRFNARCPDLRASRGNCKPNGGEGHAAAMKTPVLGWGRGASSQAGVSASSL
eukprot:202061-Chlamydomonas_euryale.AAC.4